MEDRIDNQKAASAFTEPKFKLRRNFLTQLGILFFATTIIIITVGTIFTYTTEQKMWQGRQAEAARNASTKIYEFLRYNEYAIEAFYLFGADEFDMQSTWLQDLSELNPSIDELVYVDPNGKILHHYLRKKGGNLENPWDIHLDSVHEWFSPGFSLQFKDRVLPATTIFIADGSIASSEWFTQAQMMRRYRSDTLFSPTNQIYLILARATPDGSVIAARVNVDIFLNTVSDIRFGETGKTFLVDHTGKVLAHTDQSVIFSNISIVDHPQYQELLDNPGIEWYGHAVNFENTPVVSYAVPVGNTDWTLITEVDQKESYASSRAVFFFLLLILSIFLSAVMLLSSNVMKKVVITPVKALIEGTRQLGNGNLSFQFTQPPQDEIGTVMSAFNLMAQHLAQQNTQLNQRANEFEALFEISLCTISQCDLKTLFSTVARSVMRLVSHVFNIHLFSYEDGVLSFNTSLWWNGREDFMIVAPDKDGITYQAATQKEPIFVFDYHSTKGKYIETVPASMISLPLKIGDKVVGVMNIALDTYREFTEEELRVLHLITDQTAIAVENLTLNEQIRHELKERKLAEGKLQILNQELEYRVQERTKELSQLNDALTIEAAERKAAINQLNASVREKEVLLREIHHRVKNNLQVISSLLNLQSGKMDDEATKGVLKESQNRVRSMALIHEKLYRSENLAQIDFKDYINELTAYLMHSYLGSGKAIRIDKKMEKVMIPIDLAVPCGLIINELVTNAFKYAYPNQDEGTIHLSLIRLENGVIQLIVKDDGIGMPPDFDIDQVQSLGLRLVKMLAIQIEGELEVIRNPGTTFKIEFAIP